MIDFTLAEILTGLDMSHPETDHHFRPRVIAAMLAHHQANQRAAFGGASVSDLLILLDVAGSFELDAIGKHYGVTRSQEAEAGEPE
jgi:hypothetical protein